MVEDEGDRVRGDREDNGDGGDWGNSRINVETASLYFELHRKSYDHRPFCLSISHVFLHIWFSKEHMMLPPRLLGLGLLRGLELLRGLFSFLNTGVPSPWKKISHEVPRAHSRGVPDGEIKKLDNALLVDAIAVSELTVGTSLSKSRGMGRSNTLV
jgi:hypothetical protein